ncbi:MAG: hypothetical protein FWH57_02845 [Oscillospiraceae bacterium]|nr:hypothetical protein [Oscillospiraceae bacterium]
MRLLSTMMKTNKGKAYPERYILGGLICVLMGASLLFGVLTGAWLICSGESVPMTTDLAELEKILQDAGKVGSAGLLMEEAEETEEAEDETDDSFSDETEKELEDEIDKDSEEIHNDDIEADEDNSNFSENRSGRGMSAHNPADNIEMTDVNELDDGEVISEAQDDDPEEETEIEEDKGSEERIVNDGGNITAGAGEESGEEAETEVYEVWSNYEVWSYNDVLDTSEGD